MLVDFKLFETSSGYTRVLHVYRNRVAWYSFGVKVRILIYASPVNDIQVCELG